MERQLHHIDELAYIDGINYLVPCKVIFVKGLKVVVKVTATINTYKRNDILELSGLFVVPRTLVKQFRGVPYILPILFQWSES